MSRGWSKRQGRIRTGVISALAGLMLMSGIPAFSAGEATETVPSGFGYAGRLRRDGALFTGQALWRLAIVDAEGRVLWTNDGSGQIPPAAGVVREVAGGVVNLAVGQPQVAGEAMQPVPSAVFAAPRTYMRAWVAAPTTAQPEELIAGEQPVPHAQAFQSVPYSHRAAEAGRAESAGRADVASRLAPLAVGQPVEVQGDLRVHGRVLDADGRDLNRVGAASSPPDSDDDHDDRGKRGRVTFDRVTTRELIVTESVSLPGGVFTSTVTQVQTLVVESTAVFRAPVQVKDRLMVGTGTIIIGPSQAGTIADLIHFAGGSDGSIQSERFLNLAVAGNPLVPPVLPARMRLLGSGHVADNSPVIALEALTNITPMAAVGPSMAYFQGRMMPTAVLQASGSRVPGFEITGDVFRADYLVDIIEGMPVFETYLNVDSVGRVGIGTTSPGARLDIQQPATSGQVLRIRTGVGAAAEDRLSISALGQLALGPGLMKMRLGNFAGDPNEFQIRVNHSLEFEGVKDVPALPAWILSLSPGADRFAVSRVNGLGPGGDDLFQLTEGGAAFFRPLLSVSADAPEVEASLRNATFGTGRDWRLISRSNGLLAIADGVNGDRVTINPGGDMVVAGELTAHGIIHAAHGDVAERFMTAETLRVGEAVVPDEDGSGRVVRSTRPRFPGFLGIVADKPGIILAEKVAGPPIAIVGRVLALVSDEGGPIVPGTPLTTSSTPGHLMRADAKTPPGAIVGIALGRLDSGTKLIEIVLR